MSRRGRSIAFILGLCILIAVLQLDGLAEFLNKYIGGGLDWSTGLVALLKANTQGLIVIVILNMFMTFSGLRIMPSDLGERYDNLNRLVSELISRTPGKALTELGLDKLYGSGSGQQMVGNILSVAPPLLDFSVTIYARKLDETSNEIEVDLSYKSKAKEYYVIVSDNPTVIEALLATGLISEGFTSADKTIPAEIVRYERSTDASLNSRTKLQFDELNSPRKKFLFRGRGLSVDLDGVSVYKAKDSPAKKLQRYELTYHVKIKITKSKNIQYTYWMNDRVSNISTIKINLKGLELSDYSSAKLHRFVASSQWPVDSDLSSGECIVQLNTWAVAGDGIFVTWYEDD